MKICTLQFAPVLGERDKNIANASRLIEQCSLEGTDLLVLPELAFSGYAFPSLEAITPFLEPTSAGVSTEWAATTARQLRCYVAVGYPERSTAEAGKTYNSLVVVDPAGHVVSHYRKSFLYYTDETWAAEGNGFGLANLPDLLSPAPPAQLTNGNIDGTGDPGDKVALGICMDINPYKFEAPWDKYEFANHVMDTGARLVILSTAWLTHLLPDELADAPDAPDIDTLNYWVARMKPLMDRIGGAETVIVFANRCGLEPGTVAGVTRAVDEGGESLVAYAGSSCVMGFKDGRVRIWDMLGRAKETILEVDTSLPAKFELVKKPAE